MIYEKHGLRKTLLYRKWDAMIQRCHNPKCKPYYNYGGRGIFVCDEWRTFINFYSWGITKGDITKLELDRIDNEKGYSPDNCRFVSHSINNRNKRDNLVVEYLGAKRTLSEWAERYGFEFKTLQYRVKNWSIERAFTERVKTITK